MLKYCFLDKALLPRIFQEFSVVSRVNLDRYFFWVMSSKGVDISSSLPEYPQLRKHANTTREKIKQWEIRRENIQVESSLGRNLLDLQKRRYFTRQRGNYLKTEF
jgi:hypothetical protein